MFLSCLFLDMSFVITHEGYFIHHQVYDSYIETMYCSFNYYLLVFFFLACIT